MPNKDKVRGAFIRQRISARQRGIPFLLTYEQWCMVWFESGKWEERGKGKGKYVMSRPNDSGAYEIGNVVICLGEDNSAERMRLKPLLGALNPNYGGAIYLSELARRRERDEQGRFITKATA